MYCTLELSSTREPSVPAQQKADPMLFTFPPELPNNCVRTWWLAPLSALSATIPNTETIAITSSTRSLECNITNLLNCYCELWAGTDIPLNHSTGSESKFVFGSSSHFLPQPNQRR